MSKKVIIGISGGVDSSVAALLLQEQGFCVEAVFMKNWEEKDSDTDPHSSSCTAAQDFVDARSVCDQLHIPLHVVNFSQEYWQRVFQYMLDEYAKGRTPNPDIMCNKEIKFKEFLNHAKTLNADYIATGHYARNICTNDILMENRFSGYGTNRPEQFEFSARRTRSRAAEHICTYVSSEASAQQRGKPKCDGYKCKLYKALDPNKDQSYFLYTLGQQQLAYTLFPLGNLLKNTVRDIAKKAHLSNHAKKDSTGICFIGERNFKKFLSEYLLAKPGEIVTTEKEIIGKHDGLMFYTLGQRQGLGIGGKKGAPEAPWYVVKKDLINNKLIIAQNPCHPLLMSKILYCDEIHWIAEKQPEFPLQCLAKIRYRQTEQPCTINKITEQNYCVTFVDAQRAITPGQAAVFYAEDGECLGGGTIM